MRILLLGTLLALGIYICLSNYNINLLPQPGADPREQVVEGVTTKLIVTVDGCRVYAVDVSWSRRIYFANCGSSSTTSWSERHGKTTVDHQVQTHQEPSYESHY